MRIGIDIDETLTDTEISFNEVIKKHNINFSTSYKEKWNEDEAIYLLTNFADEIYLNAKIKEYAKEALDYLHKQGHELVVITARSNTYSKNTEAITKKMLEENNIKTDKLYFHQWIKSDICKELKVDLMIDDSIDVYNNMLRNNIECILFGDKIKSWQEVLEYIKRKEISNGQDNKRRRNY